MATTRTIYCTGCVSDVQARLTDGQERYPHRPDLWSLPFWKCDKCGNYVGCHHKTSRPTRPLGCIATPEIVNARKHIHAILDPIWKSKQLSRGQAYKFITDRLGHDFHSGEIRSVEEARDVYRIVLELKKSLAVTP